MADPGSPDIQFKPAEVLHFGGETTVRMRSPDLQRAKDKGAELRKEKANSTSAKSFFESYRNKPSERNLTGQNKEDLNLEFGAGEAKRNASDGIEVPTTPEEKSLYDEAQAEIKNINDYIQYSEITAEAKKTGKPVATILSERAAKGLEGPRNQGEFDAQKQKAVDYIISTDVIQISLPDVAAITDQAIKRKLIEDLLAADPALRTKIVEKMVGIADRVKALPDAPESKEVTDAQDSKKDAETKITENLDMVRDRLKDLGIDDVKANALRNEVEKFIKDGKSLDQVLGYLRSESIGQLKNVPQIQEYITAKNLEEPLQQRREKLDATRTVPSAIKSVEDQLQIVQKTIANFEGDPALKAELVRYENTVIAFTNQKDSSSSTAEGGIYLSPVAHGIDQIVKSQKAIVTADKIIKEKGALSGKARETWRNDRLVQESNLISEMKNVIPSSIAEVLSDRYDEMEKLEQQRMERVAKEQEDKGKKGVADGIRKVEAVKAKRWIEYDYGTRQRKVNALNLGNDIKFVAYAGEEGFKRLILRDSELVLNYPAAGTPIPVWANVDLASLPEDIRRTLDGVYETQKDSYKQKLFGDFYLERGKDRGLTLKNHEYELLQKNFGEAFEKGVASKAEAQEIVEKLKKSGVKMNTGLLALLGLLIVGAAVGIKKAATRN